jgi:hypothetical protein
MYLSICLKETQIMIYVRNKTTCRQHALFMLAIVRYLYNMVFVQIPEQWIEFQERCNNCYIFNVFVLLLSCTCLIWNSKLYIASTILFLPMFECDNRKLQWCLFNIILREVLKYLWTLELKLVKESRKLPSHLHPGRAKEDVRSDPRSIALPASSLALPGTIGITPEKHCSSVGTNRGWCGVWFSR